VNFELFKARKEKNLTQQQLADVATLKRSRYCRIELGKVEPTVWEAFKIATAVERNIDEIFLFSNVHILRGN
jgi:DNA-binding XRE family transcriptional regulator